MRGEFVEKNIEAIAGEGEEQEGGRSSQPLRGWRELQRRGRRQHWAGTGGRYREVAGVYWCARCHSG